MTEHPFRITAQKALLLALVAATSAACGGDERPAGPTRPAAPLPWENSAPTLFAASPTAAANEIAVGESITILGKDFIDPGHGQAQLQMRGTYFAQDGSSYPVNLTGRAERVSENQLSWRLWPNIVFHPQGDVLGKFVGELVVTNIGHDASQLSSTALPLDLTIKPSLIPRALRPAEGGCQPVVPFTVDDTPMELSFEAVGLRPGSVDTPLIFSWTLLKEHWDVDLTNFDTSFDPTKLFTNDSGAFMLQQKVTAGSSASLRDRGTTHFLLKVKDDFFDRVSVKKLATKSLAGANETADSYTANISLAVVDATGKTARLTFPLDVRRVATLHYDNNQFIAERYAPQKVSECIPGGNIGRQVSYREDKSETKARDLGWSYNASAATTLGLPSNPFALALNPSATFGIDYRASVSSQSSKGLDISSQVLPGFFGVFYRQTTKVHRIAKISGNTKCGEEIDLGEAILTDWIFAPDLAMGPSCPPPSNLPPPERFR